MTATPPTRIANAAMRRPADAEIAPTATRAAQTPAATMPPTVSRARQNIRAKCSMKRREGRRASGGGQV